MQTRLYSDLLGTIMSLTGQSFSVVESTLVKNLINRRAYRAYRSSNYWSRFLKVGERRNVTKGIIPFDEEGYTTIDTFLRIHANQPHTGVGGLEYQFSVTSEGANLVLYSIDSGDAYVTYKAALEDFYGDNQSETKNVPSEWFQYIAFGVYADYLKREGQQEKAAFADQEAELILQDELIRLDEMHTNNVVANRIFTHANMATRYHSGPVVTNMVSSSASYFESESGLGVITEDAQEITTQG